METTAREQILKKVRQALMEKTKNPSPHIDLETNVFALSGEDPVVDFASQFTSNGGQFFYCSNKFDFIDLILKMSEDKLWNTFYCKETLLLKMLVDTPFKFIQTQDALSQTDATLTLCEKLIYRSGSIIVSNLKQPRNAIIQAQIHIVVAFTSQLKNDMKDAFNELKQQNGGKMPKWFSMISGLSYTNQIESTKIDGVHGAKELYCFLIEDRKADFLNKLFEE